jgi:hypothetical protein
LSWDNPSKLLDEMGYSNITEAVVIRKVLDSLRKGVDYFGEPMSSLLFKYVCNSHNLKEEELIGKYGLLEKSINALFGDSSDIVISSIKRHLIEHSITKNPLLSVEEIIAQIRKAEVLDFIRNREGHEHIVFLYGSEKAKNIVLSEFFDPSASPYALKALISLNGHHATTKFCGVQSIAYSEFLKVEKAKAMDEMFRWLGKIHKSNLSGRETRVAGEDASWFLRNGFESELLDAEQVMGKQVKDRMSVLCSYSLYGIEKKSQIEKIIQCHEYVIIDEPFAVYREK